MARKQTTIVRCDRHGCKEVAEVMDTNEAAPGWIAVYTEKNFKYVGRNEAKEFCSEKCVAIWARDRGKFQKETAETRPMVPGNGIQPPAGLEDEGVVPLKNDPTAGMNRDEITAFNRSRVLEALEIDPEHFVSADDIAGVLEMHSTTTRKYLEELSEDGKIEVNEGLSQRGRPMRTYRLK